MQPSQAPDGDNSPKGGAKNGHLLRGCRGDLWSPVVFLVQIFTLSCLRRHTFLRQVRKVTPSADSDRIKVSADIKQRTKIVQNSEICIFYHFLSHKVVPFCPKSYLKFWLRVLICECIMNILLTLNFY